MQIDDGIKRDPEIEEIIEPIRKGMGASAHSLKFKLRIVSLLDYLMNDDFAESLDRGAGSVLEYRRALAGKVKEISSALG